MLYFNSTNGLTKMTIAMRAQRFEELVGYGFVRDFCTEDIQAKSGSGSVARISNEELSGC